MAGKSPQQAKASPTNNQQTTTRSSPTSWLLMIASVGAVIIAVTVYSLFFNYELVEFNHYTEGEVNPDVQDITHWEFGSQIGKGGYSRVYLGYRKTKQGSTNLLVRPTNEKENDRFDHAIKIIPKARYFRQAMDPKSSRLSQINESALMSSVWSERNAWVAFSLPTPIPHVLPLSHIFQDRHAIYYIVPLINGGDLDRSLNMFGPMNEHTVRYYAASIITALEGMHARGYVYKDIKLKNLLLDEEGKLQMTDFGLSRSATTGHQAHQKETNCVTNGVAGRAGTKSYKAPEILAGQGHSFPSDFYALGVVLYKMLTGHKLYHSDHDIPSLRHFLRIPKYYHYTLKQPKWRAYGVYDTFNDFQRSIQMMQVEGQTRGEAINVLDYDVQRSFLTYHIGGLLNSKFSREMGSIGREKLDKLIKERSQAEAKAAEAETGKTEGKTKVENQNDEEKPEISFGADELFVDGVGPIFGPDDADQHRKHVKNGTVSNSKGQIKGKLAWLSLSDDVIDLLTQLTELNPFYRIGTPNRRYRNYDPRSLLTTSLNRGLDLPPQQGQQQQQQGHPQTGSIVSLNTGFDHQVTTVLQDFDHTEPALISFEQFSYNDINSIAKSTSPETHCFPFQTDVNIPLKSVKGKDENGKWRGLHSGYVEIKNHPWFKNFDWDKMAEINPVDPNTFTPGHELIQFASVDVRNYRGAKFPTMIDAKDDLFDERYQSIFKGLEFGTKL